MSSADHLKPIIEAKRAEAAKLRASLPDLRAMAKGAALSAKVVPETVGAKAIAAGVPKEAAEKLVELAGNAAEDVVTKLLEQLAKHEARATALEEMVGQLEVVAGQFEDVPAADAPDSPPADGTAADGAVLAPQPTV